jgi:hypothetical protein
MSFAVTRWQVLFSRMTKDIAISLLATAAVLACGGRDGSSGNGEFTVEWLGADTGGISTAPVSAWCRGDTVLKVIATRGEDGVGVAVFPAAEPEPGSYPIFDPVADSVRSRPGAFIGSRWLDDKSVVAYQSDSGSVVLTREATGLAGTFTVRMHGVNSSDTIRMTGHFGGVTPGPCPTDPTPPRAAGQ